MPTEPVQHTRFTLLKLRAGGEVWRPRGSSRAGVKARGGQQPRLAQWAQWWRRVWELE